MFLVVVGWVVFVLTTLVIVIGVGGHVTDLRKNRIRRELGMSYEQFAYGRFVVVALMWVVSGWYIFDYVG